jgi:uncharacterized protein YpmB
MITLTTAAALIIGLIVGAVISWLITSYVAANHFRRFIEDEETMNSEAAQKLMLLQARLRAVQDKGIVRGKEVVYSIQQPNGRFGKFTLPLV